MKLEEIILKLESNRLETFDSKEISTRKPDESQKIIEAFKKNSSVTKVKLDHELLKGRTEEAAILKELIEQKNVQILDIGNNASLVSLSGVIKVLRNNTNIKSLKCVGTPVMIEDLTEVLEENFAIKGIIHNFSKEEESESESGYDEGDGYEYKKKIDMLGDLFGEAAELLDGLLEKNNEYDGENSKKITKEKLELIEEFKKSQLEKEELEVRDRRTSSVFSTVDFPVPSSSPRRSITMQAFAGSTAITV